MGNDTPNDESSWGALLREWRENTKRWSQQELVDHVVQLAYRTNAERGTNLNVGLLQKWENGTVRRPHFGYQRLLAELGAPTLTRISKGSSPDVMRSDNQSIGLHQPDILEAIEEGDCVRVPVRTNTGEVVFVTIPRRLLLKFAGISAVQASIPDTDAAVDAVRIAVMAVSRDRPGGQVQPVELLRARVTATIDAHNRCDRGGEVGAALPGLIRDLHTSIAAGREVAELLDLAVLLHSHATVGWLRVAGAPIELRELAAGLGTRAAQDRDTPEARGLAVWGGLYVLVTAGAVDLAVAELDAVSVPTRTPEGMQLAGTLALCRSFLAAVDSRPGDVAAPLEYAAELAGRTGEVNAYGLGFGPQDIGQWRARSVLETGDHELAARIAEDLRPETHPLRSRQAAYWVNYGRALSRLRGRYEEAVEALRRAEQISPHVVQRDPITREVLAELRTRVRPGSLAGRELRGMAYRAGLPV